MTVRRMSTWSWLRGLLGRGDVPRIAYSPRRNGAAYPGEVVWVSVPFEDRPGEAKDRSVQIVGRKGRGTVLGLMLSTQAARAHQDGWQPLGTGRWDRLGRASFVRLDRVLELEPRSIRRERRFSTRPGSATSARRCGPARRMIDTAAPRLEPPRLAAVPALIDVGARTRRRGCAAARRGLSGAAGGAPRLNIGRELPSGAPTAAAPCPPAGAGMSRPPGRRSTV